MSQETEIRFYHLERQPVEQALPALLSKIYKGGHKIVLKADSASKLADLDTVLWTYSPSSFLPHGTEKMGMAAEQPIWLTTKDENPNEANVLVLTENTPCAIYGEFDICCEIFDGRLDEQLSAARERWKAHKDNGFKLTYWQQTDKGWEKKAES